MSERENFYYFRCRFFSKINIDRSIYRFSVDQCIDFWQIFEHSHVAYHSGSVFGPEHESGNIFSKIDIDRVSTENRYIDFRSINVSIFAKSEHSHVAYHSGSVFGPEHESGNIFSKIHIDRPKIDISIDRYWFSIDQCIDFCQILEHSHVAYHSGSVLGPEHESGNIFFENRYRSIDILIFDRSMCISIFDKFSSHVAYRSGSVFGPEHESGIHFSKFDIVRLISRFSVHQYNRFLSSKFEFGIFLDISLFLR